MENVKKDNVENSFFNKCFESIKIMSTPTFKKNFYSARAYIELNEDIFFNDFKHNGVSSFYLIKFESFRPDISFEKSKLFLMKEFNLADDFWSDYDDFTIGLYLRNLRKCSRIEMSKQTGLSPYKISQIENFYYKNNESDILKYLRQLNLLKDEDVETFKIQSFNENFKKLFLEK